MRCLSFAVLFLLPALAPAQGTRADYDRAAKLGALRPPPRSTVTPHWFPDGRRFWYVNELPGGAKEHVLVDAVAGTRRLVQAADLPVAAEQAPTPRPARRPPANRSPDGRLTAIVREHNVWLRDADGAETQLSRDGTQDDRYTGRVTWSPDSTKLLAIRSTVGGDRRVTLVESAPKGQLQPVTSSYAYLKPGDPIPQPRPHLFDVAAKREIPVAADLMPNPWDVSHEHWAADSSRAFVMYNQRGHQVVRLLAIDAASGAVSAVVDEACPTFFDYAHKLFAQHDEATDTVLWASERSGWNHLYRVHRRTGKAEPVTRGDWLVRGVDRVDADGTVTLRTNGEVTGQDPYHVHFARVNMDGTGFTRLTAGDGTHVVQWSPDRRFLVDTFSRVDAAPVTELRTAAGERVCTLEAATAAGPTPERFVSKGRDGATDIYGVIHRPSTFDPARRYPVIECIYAGPHGQHVPKAFRASHPYPQRLAELGFVVVQIDGMGTNWRSKAFHDVAWKNLGDAGFPDRIAWIKAAAARFPELDLSRGVGIFGGSAGGQNALRGMTEYPDFYTVGVADCGCHDNRMDKVWWNELWMGWPVGPHYAEQSNVTNAHKLRGKLLLVVGELDKNVDPASTMQVASALVKADRDFDLLVIPGAGHGAAETPYGSRRRADFFVRHLLGVEPRGEAAPDRSPKR